MIPTIVDLIRHGEPDGGIRYRGHHDDPLSTKGWRQMEEAVGDYSDWDLIASSPLSRCLEFAEKTAKRLELPLEIEPRFREFGFGSWEGRTAAEIAKIDPGALERFYRDPAHCPPREGEPLSGFQTRISTAWDKMLSNHPGKRILLVCHGGTIRMVLTVVLQIPVKNLFKFTVPNAGITRIQHFSDDTGGFTQLIFHHGSL